MSGVYGTFVECFPELFESFKLWDNDETLADTVVGLYIPSKGESIVRKKFLSGNTVLDLNDDDLIFVPEYYSSLVKEGRYFRRRANADMQRIVRKLPYDTAAGYYIYAVQRVSGTRPNQTDTLNVAEATYD